MLNDTQIEQFWKDGYLVVDNAIEQDALQALRTTFSDWVTQSQEHATPFGETIDGRPRFDVEPGHTAEKPGLRRVNAPIEISQAYFDAMASSRMTDYVATLIGPNVKAHHSKINSKLPGSGTQVKWHQDFPFTPHSNDDLVTALLMVDEVTEQNGPLEVIPGSHKGDIHDLWHDGVFTGAVADDIAADCQSRAVTCTGPAGSVCLMHSRLLHGSAPNHSDQPRTLFICVYSAEDAVSYASNPVPNKYEGLVVRGKQTNRVRSVPFDIPLPQKPTTASFFDQQAKHGNAM